MKSNSVLIAFFIIFFISCTNVNSKDLNAEIKTIENGLTPAIIIKGETPKQFTLSERMEYYKVPGVSIAVVKSGKIRWAKGYGIANTENGKEVGVNTLFQAGSVSKPLAALSALKLVEQGLIDLDKDVNQYLKEWKIPENDLTKNEKVTLRRLLTHTAGITITGFPGYSQDSKVPTITQVLNGEGNTAPILVDTIPGSIWRYSGGGYTIMEKLVEDMSGLPFEKYMSKNILLPLQMTNSTYEQPLPENRYAAASAGYDWRGKAIKGLWHIYPEQAAAGLWTTPTDLAKYCIAIHEILTGKRESVLSQDTVRLILTRHKNNWGLGPLLKGMSDSLIIYHGGANAGFYCEMHSFPYQGSAVIVMTNSVNGSVLIQDILRSVSSFYNWDIVKPTIVEPYKIPKEELKKFTGKYKLAYELPDIDEYFLDIIQEGDSLVAVDNILYNKYSIVPVGEMSFLVIDSGESLVFQKDVNGKINKIMVGNSLPFILVE